MNTILLLYLLFVKIGFFTFGGGYAMIPLFQDELVTARGWMSPEDFANLMALAQMTPGPVGLNAATYIGYRQAGVTGAIAGTLGIATPSLILVLAAACFFTIMKDNRYMKAALSGIRPATLGLIAAATLFFAGTSVFTEQIQVLWRGDAAAFRLCREGALIFILTLFVHWKWKPGILWILSGAAVISSIFACFD